MCSALVTHRFRPAIQKMAVWGSELQQLKRRKGRRRLFRRAVANGFVARSANQSRIIYWPYRVDFQRDQLQNHFPND